LKINDLNERKQMIKLKKAINGINILLILD
jgi:hypothetical protein